MPLFDLKILGSLVAGDSTFAMAVNSKGMVVGQSGNKAFFYDAGGIHAMPTDPNGAFSQATGVNDAGQIVGFTQSADGRQQPFLFSGGSVHYLPIPGTAVLATGINNAGQVVGFTQDQAPYPNWLWTPDSANGVTGNVINVAFAREPSNYSAINQYGVVKGAAINDTGQMCGQANFGAEHDHAFLWTGTPTGPSVAPIDLGVLVDGDQSIAYAINSAGAVAGRSSNLNQHLPFLWQPVMPNGSTGLGLINLGVPAGSYGEPYGVNAAGTVVGMYQVFGSVDKGEHGLIASGGASIQLDSQLRQGDGTVVVSAFGINEGGQIVGTADADDGDNFVAVLLTPVKVPTRPSAAALIDIIFGIINDSSGIGIKPGGGIVRVPPGEPIWQFIWNALPAETRDVLVGLAVRNAAGAIGSAQSRRELQAAAVTIMRRALDQMEKNIAGG